MKEKAWVPLTWDKCPVCGSKERAIKSAIDKLKEEGKLRKELFPEGGGSIQIPLIDQTRPPILSAGLTVLVPILIINFEVCGEPGCGNIYCTKFDVTFKQVPVQFQTMQSPPPP